jgi:hypothetical protein
MPLPKPLPRTHAAIGWPRDGAEEPPPYDGPEEIPPEDQCRVVDPEAGYVACHKDHLDNMQTASNDRIAQGQERFLRRASLPELVEAAEQAAEAFRAMGNRGFDTAGEWGELYTKAFYTLEGSVDGSGIQHHPSDVGRRRTRPDQGQT